MTAYDDVIKDCETVLVQLHEAWVALEESRQVITKHHKLKEWATRECVMHSVTARVYLVNAKNLLKGRKQWVSGDRKGG